MPLLKTTDTEHPSHCPLGMVVAVCLLGLQEPCMFSLDS